MLKRTILFLAVAGSIVSCKQAPDSVEAITGAAQEVPVAEAAISQQVDLSASSLEWIGTKLSTYHAGTVPIASGELLVQDGKLLGGSFTIQMNALQATNMDEGSNAKLTGHLRSADFFDTETYPQAVFVITSVKAYSGGQTDKTNAAEINEYTVTDPNVMISGNLKIKDVTNNISFPAKVMVNKSGVDAVAKFNIDRKKWGIVYPGMPDDLIQDLIWFGVSIKTGTNADMAYVK
ncbi:MAG: YceI family protein [Chitinophagales bacterium]